MNAYHSEIASGINVVPDQCLLFIVYLLSDIILLEHSHVLVKSC